jgi:hypothetical protein
MSPTDWCWAGTDRQRLQERVPRIDHLPEWRSTVAALARTRPQSILLACMPKSGSSFLAATLAQAAGYPLYQFVYTYDRNEQDLYLPALVGALGLSSPTVTQQHVRATGSNLDLMQLFNLRAVLLIRNLFDALVSLRDHILTEGARIPMAYIPDSSVADSPETLLDAVVDLAGPWYVGFYAAWACALREGWRAHQVRYEELTADPIATVCRILEYCEVPREPREVAEALDHARKLQTRFNKGIRGRGDQLLSAAQKERLVRLTRHYRDVDFSAILS